MRHRFLSLGLVGILAAFAIAGRPAAAPSATESPGTMWDLSDLYASPQAWSEAYMRTKTAAEHLADYRGTLGNDATSMLTALDAIFAVRKSVFRAYVYASLKGDENLKIAVDQERRQQAQALATLMEEKTAWVAPEVIAVGAVKTLAFQGQNPELERRFDFYLNNILRAAPHTLGLEAENVLASAGTVLSQPAAAREQFAAGELPFPTVTLSDGTQVRLDDAAYEKHRQSANRADRKLVFDAFWGAHNKFEATSGALLTTQVMGDEFLAKNRKYDSALGAAVFQDNIPIAVYRTLIAETNAALPTLRRYLRLRKRLLGISDPLQYYDNYSPMMHIAHEPKFTVADSERIVLDALRPLGKDYLTLLRRGFASNWMNAYPHEGKATGGYMAGSAYDVHPFLLLNHNDDYASLSTVAHEWGHAMHTLLADRAQSFEKSEYSTFIAESAAIANEMLLNEYMVAKAKSKDDKLFFLSQGLESIRGTFFRQVSFAEFELAIHDELEQGRPLSGARMTELYCGVLRKYYGEAEGVMKIDPTYCIEWAFIPHFYLRFYVWQYATSMAGAAQMTDSIIKGGDAAGRERFLTLLRAGGSDYPYELFKRAGVDLATPGPYRALAARMNKLMDEIEAIENQ